MPAKISNLNQGVRVKISPYNSRGIAKVTIETGRSFSKEINFAVTEYLNNKLFNNTKITRQNADHFNRE